MGKLSRRAFLAAALPLAGCSDGPYEPAPVLAMHVPLPLHDRFFVAIRTFADAEGYDLTESVIDHRTLFMLQGWRSMIAVFHKVDYTVNPPRTFDEDFEVTFMKSWASLPWDMSDQALDALITRFTSAVMASGISVERTVLQMPQVIGVARP